jgi:sn-glycerol 3-phosphate transport system permease protein
MSSALINRWLRRLPAYGVLALCAAVLMFPLYVTFANSLHEIREFLGEDPPSLWPSHPQWDNYFAGGEEGGGAGGPSVTRYLFNSLFVAGLITLGQLITSTTAAYAFAFLRFPGRGVLFALFLATMMVPLEVAVIPNFQTIQWLHWTDSYQGLVAPFLATGFGTFLLRQYFLTIPPELKDAAEMDGYGHYRFLFHVAAPLARGALATLAVFAFLQAWNQYLWPLLVTNDPDMRTVQIGIGAESQQVYRINIAFANTIIAFGPMVLLVVAFQRYLVRGLFGGSVKG